MNGVPLQLHEAILGQTGSGKSHLAKHKASHLKASGIGVLVLHMDIEPWPLACHSWQTDDPAEFLRMFWAARNCACFMELADAEVDKYDLGFHRCFTKGRHFGHRCFFVSQRAAQVHPAIRENCTSLALFSVQADPAKLWSKEFNDPVLLKAASLPPHCFYYKTNRYTPARLLKLSA
ncbi:hypothetical protein Ga0100231_023390 [Opitutaceae bacterium TAV4]|nr:hypothetical protein Ga0100231_023390 [Opitutaceae bacterium TAV4]RRK02413.1 hypothetical protein Ga0100230_004515 [Opitutaceae bacterium TAV3]